MPTMELGPRLVGQQRQQVRHQAAARGCLTGTTPSPPTKSFDFGGFDSSKLLKGENSHVH